MADYHNLYYFGLGMAGLKDGTVDLLGGKGHGLVRLSKLGVNVPRGVIVTTRFCRALSKAEPSDRQALIDEMTGCVSKKLYTFASGHGMFSVRSGAPVSMPGMMDTILNVGLTPYNRDALAGTYGNRLLAECACRLRLSALAALGFKADEPPLHTIKTVKGLIAIEKRLNAEYVKLTGETFPETVSDQIRMALGAVVKSWMSERAVAYREAHGIPDDMGTAVVFQRMVFGNFDDTSGTGVLFTRDPNTGADDLFGEYLVNAQGEEVVAGIRTPMPLSHMAPELYSGIEATANKLEQVFGDMLDIEFTVEQGKVYYLQVRSGKRTARAAIKIASDLHDEGLISAEAALRLVTPEQWQQVNQPQVDPAFTVAPTYTGIAGVPGVVSGVAVAPGDDPIEGDTIMVAKETSPGDFPSMLTAAGILTKFGGATSHAVVVARDMGKPCVVGVTDLNLDTIMGRMVTLDGMTGRVWVGVNVPVIDLRDNRFVARFEDIAYKVLGVRRRAIQFSPQAVVEVASLDTDTINNFVTEWKEGSDVVLDLTLPSQYREAEDEGLWNLLGSDAQANNEEFERVRVFLHILYEKCPGLKAAPVIAMGQMAEWAKAEGIGVVRRVDTLEDLLDGGLVSPARDLGNKLGSTALTKLGKLLGTAGSAVVVCDNLPADYAVYEALAHTKKVAA